jgi:peroxiredoxin family protein
MNVSVLCMNDELCQVYNALMTALSLLREGNGVTLFFGSKGVRAVHRVGITQLKCMPDEPGAGDAIIKRMDELDLPSAEDLLFFFLAEKGTVYACPLNTQLFNISKNDLYDGVQIADPARFYKEVMMAADMNLSF